MFLIGGMRRNAGRGLCAMTAVLAALQMTNVHAATGIVDVELLDAAAQAPVSVMVEMTARADLSQAAGLSSKLAKGNYVVKALQRTARVSQAPLVALLAQRGVTHRSYWLANAVYFKADAETLRRVAALDGVTQIHAVNEPDFSLMSTKSLASKDAHESAPELMIEPGLALVHAPEVWDLGISGQGVVVGDHDIGVEWQHPALINQYRGWDGLSADHSYNWHNAFGALDPFCTDPAVPCDSNGHGTHTTGTMIGDDGAGRRIGMAPGAQWIGCRSLLDPVLGVGTLPTYLECMEWFVAPYPVGEPDLADASKAPDVINNSWGCLEACPPTILQAADEATEAAGIVQVAAAGNEGSDCMTIAFPLSLYDSSFTVGASNLSDEMADFSSRGPVVSDLSMRIKPNIVAPGVSVISSDLDGSYGSKSGTSMAAPHVAGLVALMISAKPELRGQVREIRRIIQDTAVAVNSAQSCGDTGPADRPNSVFGHGRVDALEAVLAIPGLELPATEEVPAEPRGVVNLRGGAISLWLLLALLPLGLRGFSSTRK